MYLRLLIIFVRLVRSDLQITNTMSQMKLAHFQLSGILKFNSNQVRSH